MNKIIKLFVILFLSTLLFTSCALFKSKEKSETEVIKKQEEQTKKKTKEAALPVKVLKVEKGDLPLRLRITALADVWEKAVIKAQVKGIVDKINYITGDSVKKGALLIKLEDRDIRLNLEKARSDKLKVLSAYLVKERIAGHRIVKDSTVTKAEAERIKKEYIRASEEYKRGKITKSDFNTVKEQYESKQVYSGSMRDKIRKAQEGLTDASITLQKAELDFNRTSIRSPFPAMVADLKISKGQKVSVGQELVKVVNLHSLYLKGYALESEIANLKKGMGVRIKMDSFPDKYFKGKIQSISPEVDQEKKTITLFVEVDNSDKQILPGMNGEMDIEYKVFKNVVKVPRKAVIFRNDRPLVFVVQGKKAIWRYVKLGHQNDEEREILSGLEEGDMVVIEGQMTLAHQSRVKVVK